MCKCELLMATMMNILIMFKSTKTLLNIETVRLEVYPAKGPMLKAPAAPRALVDIVRCSMSRTTVDAGRCSHCSPSNIHRNVDDPRKKKKTSANTRKKQAVVETLPKNFRPHTRAGVAMRMAVPEACSPNTPCAQRIGTEKLGSNSREEQWCYMLYLIRVAEGKRSFYKHEG